MGLQVYTDNKKPKQLIKLIGDNSQQIIEYIDELKKAGYEILEFPPIEKHRKQWNVNIFVTEPAASE